MKSQSVPSIFHQHELPGIGAASIRMRNVSISPPTFRVTQVNVERTNLVSKPPRQPDRLITRRQSWQPTSGNHDHYENSNATDDIFPVLNLLDYRSPHNASVHDQAQKSIPTFALTPLTKTISITIGGANASVVGPQDRTQAECESSRHIPTSPLQRVAAPATCVRLGETDSKRSHFSSVHRGQQVRSNASTRSAVPQSYLTDRPQTPIAPVSIGLSISPTTSVVFSTRGFSVSEQRSGVQFSSHLRSHFSDSRPPLPRADGNDKHVRQDLSYVRISAGADGKVIVTASPSNDVKFVPPKPAQRSKSNCISLISSGSCDNLLGQSVQVGISPKAYVVRHRHSTSFSSLDIGKYPPLDTRHRIFRASSEIVLGRLKSDMPNAPPSYDMRAAKVGCSHPSHDGHSPLRNPCLNAAMSSEHKHVCGTPPGNAYSVSSRDTPSVGKSFADPPKPHRSTKTANRSQYFRIQLPCTRAASRSKDFVVTDSLKLYEEQILCHFDPAQRPQSWCSDFFPAVTGATAHGGSHSSSPVSTVSSNSSSSSDAPQSPSLHNLQLNRSSDASENRSRRWSVYPNAVTIDDSKTPTSGPTGDRNSPFGHDMYSEKPLSEAHLRSQFTKVATLAVDLEAVKHNQQVSALSPKGSRESVIAVGLSHNSDRPTEQPSCSESLGFETVRAVNVSNKYVRSPEKSITSVSTPPITAGLDPHKQIRRPSLGTPVANASSLSMQRFHNSTDDLSFNSKREEKTFNAPQSACDSEAKPTSSSASFISNSVVLPPAPPWNSEHIVNLPEVTGSFIQGEDHYKFVDSGSLKNFLPASRCRLAEVEVVDAPGEFKDLRENQKSAVPSACPSKESVDFDSAGLPPALTSSFRCDSSGDVVSSFTDAETYTFSTLDSEYLSWMRLNVRDITGEVESQNDLAPLTPAVLDTTPRSQVHHWIDLFNSNPVGLRLNFMDDSCRLAGTLRIHINLIKPVKMSLRQSVDMVSPSVNRVSQASGTKNATDAVATNDHADHQRASQVPARMVSFFLPRGTSKVVYITSSTTSANAVQSLLDRFHIQESSRKFALYEHTLERSTIVTRKLDHSDCPLLVLLNWARISSSQEKFLQLLHKKRIVLQENDTCDIDWKDFTPAELKNFLRILDKEENEYRNAILYQYGQLRDAIVERLNSLNQIGYGRELCGQNYSRVGVPVHPHAFDPTICDIGRPVHGGGYDFENSSSSGDAKTPPASV